MNEESKYRIAGDIFLLCTDGLTEGLYPHFEEMIKEIQKDAYNSALKDVQGVLPGNPCPNRREDIANAISGLRK